MIAAVIALIAALRSTVRSRAELATEMLASRHQLTVLRRQAPARLRLRRIDRVFWVLLSRTWSEWRQAVQIVRLLHRPHRHLPRALRLRRAVARSSASRPRQCHRSPDRDVDGPAAPRGLAVERRAPVCHPRSRRDLRRRILRRHSSHGDRRRPLGPALALAEGLRLTLHLHRRVGHDRWSPPRI
jgi:hypothetical protein